MQHLDDGRLQEWLDGARSGLDDEDLVAVERHLADCPSCAARAEELGALTTRTADLLSAAAEEEAATPDFTAVRVHADRMGRAGARRRGWGTARWAAGLVAAGVVAWTLGDLVNARAPTAGVTPLEATRAAPEGDVTPLAARPDGAAKPTEAPSPGPGAGSTLAPPASVVANQAAPAAGDAASGGAVPAAAAPRAARAPTGTPIEPPPAARLAPAPTPIEPPGVAEEIAVLADAGAPAAEEVSAGDTSTRATARPADASRRTLRGRVSNQLGIPLRAAQVFIAGTSIGALTGEDGAFVLALDSAVAPADDQPVTLTAQLIGYSQEQRSVLPGLDTGAIDIRLAEQALALEEIVVTGTPGSARRRALGNTVATAGAPGVATATDAPIAWALTDSAAAGTATGLRLLTLPDAVPGAIAVGTLGAATLVRRAHTLPEGTVVTLYQSASPGRLPDSAVPQGQASVSVSRGDGWVAVVGPLSEDRLRRLLERAR